MNPLFYSDFARPGLVIPSSQQAEEPEGGFVRYEEVRASAERLLVVAEELKHSADCNANPTVRYFWHKLEGAEFMNDTCNCPRGDLLREIEGVARDGN